jgi:NifU-like protein involved in Fe-S cluster formation
VSGSAHAEYADVLLDHLRHPRHPGEVTAADAEGRAQHEDCGDVVRLTFRLRGDHVAEVRFQAAGCPVALAAASAVAERLAGGTIDQALALGPGEVERALGGVPERKRGCAALATEAARLALAGRTRTG